MTLINLLHSNAHTLSKHSVVAVQNCQHVCEFCCTALLLTSFERCGEGFRPQSHNTK